MGNMTGIQDVNSDVGRQSEKMLLWNYLVLYPITAETGTLSLISVSAGRISRHDDEPTRSCSTKAVNRPRERSWSMELTTVSGVSRLRAEHFQQPTQLVDVLYAGQSSHKLRIDLGATPCRGDQHHFADRFRYPEAACAAT